MKTKLITVPAVFVSGNRLLQEESEKITKELNSILENGYKITLMSSAAVNNTLYVSYVLVKD